MKSKVLDDIFQNYSILKDSSKITKRSITKQIQEIHNKTVFSLMETCKAEKIIDDAVESLDDLMVLSLFAAFERELREYISENIESIKEKVSSPLSCIILDYAIENEIEKWRTADIIDLFKYCIHINTIGKCKQILDYRNWIAHGKNKNKLPAAQTDPKITYNTLKDFIESLE